jgi:tetratricopeptide (TPR) repeat protein
MFGKSKERYIREGDSHFENGEYMKAVDLYTKAINMSDSAADDVCQLYNKRGMAYAELGGCVDAISDYTAALKSNPEYPEPLCNRSREYLNMGNFIAAMDDISKFIELDPDFHEGYLNRAICIISKAELATEEEICMALEDLTRSLEITPNYEAYHMRGLLFSNGEMYSEALSDFREAYKLEPNDQLLESIEYMMSQIDL